MRRPLEAIYCDLENCQKYDMIDEKGNTGKIGRCNFCKKDFCTDHLGSIVFSKRQYKDSERMIFSGKDGFEIGLCIVCTASIAIDRIKSIVIDEIRARNGNISIKEQILNGILVWTNMMPVESNTMKKINTIASQALRKIKKEKTIIQLDEETAG